MTDNNDKQRARHKILGELESIRSLLDEDPALEPPLLTTPAEEAEDEPPLLTEALEEATEKGQTAADFHTPPLLTDPDASEPDTELLDSAADEAKPSTRPAETQPSLFDDEPKSQIAEAVRTEHKPEPSLPPAAEKTENPFLPKHIRERLNASRAVQQEILDRLSQHVTTGNPVPNNSSLTAKEEALVEEVLGRHLPKIEAELREKLRALVLAERSRS